MSETFCVHFDVSDGGVVWRIGVKLFCFHVGCCWLTLRDIMVSLTILGTLRPELFEAPNSPKPESPGQFFLNSKVKHHRAPENHVLVNVPICFCCFVNKFTFCCSPNWKRPLTNSCYSQTVFLRLCFCDLQVLAFLLFSKTH